MKLLLSVSKKKKSDRSRFLSDFLKHLPPKAISAYSDKDWDLLKQQLNDTVDEISKRSEE